MNPIERYNAARDAEQAAFDASPLGELVRRTLNLAPPNPVLREERLRPALAAEYAFGRRWPAFYAGRALRIW